MSNNAVAVRDIGSRSVAGHDAQSMRRVELVKPSSNPAEIMEAHKAIAVMVSEVLEPGIDYGEIPGTRGPDGKPQKALLKPGAERLAFSIGASIELEVLEKEVDHHITIEWSKRQKEWYNDKGKRHFKWVETHGTSRGLYRYVVRARLVRREDGAILGEGIGSCSTMESKYIDRPREMENTVLKMAKKRASTDAVLTTMALSGRFAPEESAGEENDEDGVVSDPTDGLTLAEALAHEINHVQLGTMSPKGLKRSMVWCDGKLQDDPDSAYLQRVAAMLAMVSDHRETNPLPPKDAPAEPAKAASKEVEPAPSATTSTETKSDTSFDDDEDDDGLPF